jgi:hypothetical protein
MKYLIAVAFFAVIIPVYGQEKGSQPRPDRGATAQPKQTAPQTPSTVNAINQQAPNEQQNGTSGHTDSYLRRLFAPANLPNIGLLLAGIAGICVAIRTLKAIERQGLSMRRQTTHLRNSVIQARNAARAAKRSADAYEQAVRLTERADVLLESAGFILSPNTHIFDGHARVVLRFKNFGRTRARDVSFRVRLVIPDVPDAYGPELPRMVLGAEQSQSVSFEPFITFLNKPTFDGVARGDITMRFESWTVYADVFDSSYTTRDVGIFNSSSMTFRIEEHIAG